MRGRAFYEAVSDALRNFLAPEDRTFSSYTTSHNIKVWFGADRREHYEAQVVRAKVARRKGGPLLEIGFHAEYPEAERSQEALDRLLAHERTWRRALGRAPEAGTFLGGGFPNWRRLSELWDGEAEGSGELAIEAAERLAAYIAALEPLRDG